MERGERSDWFGSLILSTAVVSCATEIIARLVGRWDICMVAEHSTWIARLLQLGLGIQAKPESKSKTSTESGTPTSA